MKWASNPEHRERARLSKIKKVYGISPEQYAAILTVQQCGCGICRKKDRRLCVDHCHATQVVGGLLCNKCNTGLGCFDDEPERLRAAIPPGPPSRVL